MWFTSDFSEPTLIASRVGFSRVQDSFNGQASRKVSSCLTHESLKGMERRDVLGSRLFTVHIFFLRAAQSRVGGRIHSIPTDSSEAVIELGAQWVHFQDGNPVFEFAQQNGLVDSRPSVEAEGQFLSGSCHDDFSTRFLSGP